MNGFSRRVKALAEHALGVHISRTAVPHAGKHADEAIRWMRRWTSDDVMFDVGANDGRTVLRIQEQLGSPRIFAFEPVTATYRTLVSRTSHLPNVRTFQTALGAEPAQLPIFVHQIDAMSSFSGEWAPSPVSTELVDVSTIDLIAESLGVERIHFLKIDTEGYELEVLRGAERMLRAGRIAILQLEVGFDQMKKRFLTLEEARVYLAERGYVLRGIFNQCLTPAVTPSAWPPLETSGYRAEALAYCDAVFMCAGVPR